MKKRPERHDAIRAIVREHVVRTQRELAEHLRGAGFDCTQATVSRDIADIGLIKAESGAYVLPEDSRMRRLVADLAASVACAGNLVVLRTCEGGAAAVAGAIDAAQLSGLLGSVAGDDTVFIAASTPEDASRAAALLEAIRRR